MPTMSGTMTRQADEGQVRQQGLGDKVKAFFAAVRDNWNSAKEAFMSGEAGKMAMGMGLGGAAATVVVHHVIFPLIKKLRAVDLEDVTA